MAMIDIERWYDRCLIQLKVDVGEKRAHEIRGALCLFAENPSWLAYAIADSGWRDQCNWLDGLYRSVKADRSLNKPLSSASQLIEDIQVEVLQDEGNGPVLPVVIRYGQRLTPNTLKFLHFLGYGAIFDDQALQWGEVSSAGQLETVDAINEDVVDGSKISREVAWQYNEADFDDGMPYLQTDLSDLLKYAETETETSGSLQYVESDFEYTCQQIERGDLEGIKSMGMLALSYTNLKTTEVKVSISDWVDKLIAGELLAKPMNDGYKALYIEIIRGLTPDGKISNKQLYRIIAQRLLDADKAGSNDGNLSASDGVKATNVPTLAIVRYLTDGREAYVQLKTFSNWVSVLRKLVPAVNA